MKLLIEEGLYDPCPYCNSTFHPPEHCSQRPEPDRDRL
jgi:hypothetical protein